MENEWRNRYNEVLREMNVAKWTDAHSIWSPCRLRKVAVDYGKYCWDWIGFQFYSIDDELKDKKRKE